MKVLEQTERIPQDDQLCDIINTYADRRFCDNALDVDLYQTREPEAHIPTWMSYQQQAADNSIFAVLQHSLPQFWFPVEEGVSQQERYADATRRGWRMPEEDRSNGLRLTDPDSLKLMMYESLAGTLPVLIAANRADFERLMQAFTCRSEPKDIPASMGACMLAGFNNWNRIHRLRYEWEQKAAPFNSDPLWRKEFKKILPQKSLYQDRFMVLSRGAYSAVPASAFNLTDTEWKAISLALRLEHECTHFFTKRMFQSMENHLYDEIIADFMGITGATGHYRSGWALYFLGLENYPDYRTGGRLQNYFPIEGNTPQQFQNICWIVKSAIDQLEAFYKELPPQKFSRAGRCAMLMALSETPLVKLKDSVAMGMLCERFQELFEKTQLTHDATENGMAGIVLQDLAKQID